jgi:hypothetical protein
MLGDLSGDIIGTNPKYPPIVDHSWLSVDTATYDNYPSDNNPVRIVPKLNDLWNHSPACDNGINLIPNSTVQPLGVRSAEEEHKAVIQVVREAKKVAMLGLKGKELSSHLRARFASRHLEAAAEDLKKVSEEIGLLGNVYIDASAFNSYQEAESFLKQNRNRLARDILMQSDTMGPNVVAMLASTFHKNIVAEVKYDENLFKKYRDHLISAGRIERNTVIDSKESLRKAFLQEKMTAPAPAPVKEAKKLSEAEITAGLEQISASRVTAEADLLDSLNLSKISPIVSFIQENMAKGKTASGIKDMLRSKFVLDHIKVASEAIGVALSKEGLSESNIDSLVNDGKITQTLATELKKIGKKFPVKASVIIDNGRSTRQVGVQGYLYTPPTNKKSVNETFRNASVEALRKGVEIGRIKAKLLQKLTASEADAIIAEAVIQMNALPAGVKANQPAKPKKALVPDLPVKQTLPDPSTIIPQTQEILGFFEGSQMEVDIDPPPSFGSLDIGGLQNTEGISGAL